MKKIIALITAVIILSLSGLVAHEMQRGAQKLPIRQFFPSDRTVAVWDWKNPINRSQDNLNRLNNYYYLHQINTVYVDISSFADIYKNKDKSAKQKLEDSLVAYVNTVKNHNVRVFASAGNTQWSKPSQRDVPLAIQGFVYEYNAKHPESQLSGLEFDIESYNQPGFPSSSMTEKSIVLTELLDTVKQITLKQNNYLKYANHTNVEIGFAIPYWFDDENGNIPSITWESQTGPTLYHLVDTLNTIPSSNIIVMAYRNAANGNDGVIFHSRTEIEYAQTKAQHVKVLIGQEVNDVQPSKISYFGMSISELSSEVRVINDTFKPDSSYGGIAINDLPGLQLMDATGAN